ncbi:hypothetical protein EU98_1880 [Prochlorococcus marinus str. MIT 9314]|uniref:Uncharacterized protein n=1 Tax=Prochlorococcus marinus str. MIT 9314 TaxID=167548 RepID=A0A0A2AEN2_PROMR|nr:hypothetical protein EU98_1880 [Prochlorococcus marinus str. MIT 9314]
MRLVKLSRVKERSSISRITKIDLKNILRKLFTIKSMISIIPLKNYIDISQIINIPKKDLFLN